MRRIILLVAAAVLLSGCKGNSAAAETIEERFDASVYEYSDDSVILLDVSGTESDITDKASGAQDGIFFSEDVLKDEFSFTEGAKEDGERSFEKEDVRIRVRAGESCISVNGEDFLLRSPVKEEGGKLYLSEDILFLIPGVTEVSKRRDGNELRFYVR